MISQVISITLACLLCAATLVTSQENQAPVNPIKPDELQLKPDGQTENNNNPLSNDNLNNNNNPLGNDNQNNNNNQQIQPQDLTTPMINFNEEPVNNNDRYPKLSDFIPPFFTIPFRRNPSNQQAPPRNNMNPFAYIMEMSQQQNQLFDRQLQGLSQQVEEGQQVEYLSRNGVSYMRTCTTKRV